MLTISCRAWCDARAAGFCDGRQHGDVREVRRMNIKLIWGVVIFVTELIFLGLAKRGAAK
jgi:hypothetical protein